jgi:microcompartment protein CcmK/EutM
MRLARVLGSVTLSAVHPALRGGMLRLLVPLSGADLERRDGPAEPLVAWDSLGAGVGQIVAFSEGGEAAQPFRPVDRPVDAYVAAIIDHLEIPAVDTRQSVQAAPSGHSE